MSKPSSKSKTETHAHSGAHEGAVVASGHGEGAIHHETTDVAGRPMVIAGISVIIMTVVAFAIIIGFMWVLGTIDRGSTNVIALPANAATPLAIPAPQLQSNGRAEADRIIAEQNEKLETYGWVDQNTGVVHMPIERAMELIVERGVVLNQAP